jgi:hypothetical protein
LVYEPGMASQLRQLLQATFTGLVIVNVFSVPALSQSTTEQPYPMLEFFLASECIERDVEVSTQIAQYSRSSGADPVILQRVYALIHAGRLECLRNHLTGALKSYEAAAIILSRGPLAQTPKDQVRLPFRNSKPIWRP